MNRRNVLFGGLALAASSHTTVGSASVTEAPFDLQNWLNTADLDTVAHYHAAHLAEVMGRMDPTRKYRSEVDVQYGFAIVVGDSKKRPASVAKVYSDDGSPLLADDVTGTTAFADWQAGGYGD